MEKQSWVIDGDSYSESYTYNDPVVGADASVRPKDGSLATVTTATGDTVSYGYDALKRVVRETVKNGEDTRFYTAYAYKDVVYETQTTGQVEYRNVRKEDGSLISGFKYTYDAVGNITDIYESQLVGNNTERRILAHYEYDRFNQLVKEVIYTYASTNLTSTPTTEDTYDYVYDTAGNILKEYENEVLTKTYSYTNTGWRDQLTAVNGQTNTYDGAGNPTVYKTGAVDRQGNAEVYYMAWEQGRQLSALTYDDGQWYFEMDYQYDADGIRVSKSMHAIAGESPYHTYITQNGKVVRDTIVSGTSVKVLDFTYDNAGRPFALTYTNGTAEPQVYYYVLNLQGDVVKLINGSGETVANYRYNAWGEILESSGTMASINPLRYRGYYYDTETGFYYLQSRYYDPVNCRFISADGYASTGQGFLGYNMFAYCNNNPVMCSDSSSHAACTWDGGFWGLESMAGLVDSGGGGSYSGFVLGGGSSGQSRLKEIIQIEREYWSNLFSKAGRAISTFGNKTGAFVTAIYNNVEFSFGVGQGLAGEVIISGMGLDVGAYANYFCAKLKDGIWIFGQDINAGITGSFIFDFGFSSYEFREYGGDWIQDNWILYDQNQSSISLWGFSAYILFLGVSVDLSIDLAGLLQDIDAIF